MVSPGSTAVRPFAPVAAAETPFFFEASGRPLYAVHHAAKRPSARVLVCVHSAGVEQMTLYGIEVVTARLAAQAGVPVLRYHARGHGDSAGDFADVTFEGLVEDALSAADEARKRSGASEVVWLGARLGALVAAEAARRRGDRTGLALWEPVHRPVDYFRGQLRGLLYSQVAAGKKPEATVEELLERVERDGATDVHGYALHRTLVRSFEAVELSRLLESWRGATLLAQIQSRAKLSPPNATLAALLESRSLPIRTLIVGEEPGWHFISNPAWESDALARGTVEWLRGLA